MFKWTSLVAALMALNLLHAQMMDDFSMPNLSLWQGDTSDFIVNDAGMLQLDASEPGSSFIYLPLSVEPATWKLDIKLDFNPSDDNGLIIYLLVDDADLDVANGYFLSLGEDGGDDAWILHVLINGSPEVLASGEQNHSVGPAHTLHVSLQEDTLWMIGSDASVTDILTSHPLIDLSADRFFGIACQYTETRKNRFFFDNLSISSGTFRDTVAPVLTNLKVEDAYTLRLTFSEQLDPSNALSADRYSILPDVGALFIQFGQFENELILRSEQPLVPGISYTLQIDDLEDVAGNGAAITHTFMHQPVEEVTPYQILINEIYDDPTPSHGLPEVEYIELFVDQANAPVELSELQLVIGEKVSPLPSTVLLPGSYTILCDAKDAGSMAIYGDVIGMTDFNTLRNTGNTVQLQERTGEVVHTVRYDDSWYGERMKKNGGWSLELINPSDPCALAQNWHGSTSIIGGTPGQQNSVYDTSKPVLALRMLPPRIIADDQIEVVANKQMPNVDLSHFSISGGAAKIIEVDATAGELDRVILHLAPAMRAGESYLLSIDGLRDCAGGALDGIDFEIRLPDVPEPGDLVINEVLFNPVSGGSDFIEILNVSNKVFRASDLYIGNFWNGRQSVEQIVDDLNLWPGTHLVVTEDPVDLLARYTVEDPSLLLENDLPSLADDEGNVTLYIATNGESKVIDQFDYQKSFHSPLLKVQDGVSLERISPTGTTQDSHNWHSAAQSAGYATPTSANSQQADLFGIIESFSIREKVFSPDGDGFNDFLVLQYELGASGTLATIKIFDSAGRMVKELASNLSLATSGHIIWDGANDQGRKSPIGIYTILVEIFRPDGFRDRWKETFVLAARMD